MTEKPAEPATEKKEDPEWKEPTETVPAPESSESIEARLTLLEAQLKSLLTAKTTTPPPEPKVERVESLEVKATPAPKVETQAETVNLPAKRKRKKLRLW